MDCYYFIVLFSASFYYLQSISQEKQQYVLFDQWICRNIYLQAAENVFCSLEQSICFTVCFTGLQTVQSLGSLQSLETSHCQLNKVPIPVTEGRKAPPMTLLPAHCSQTDQLNTPQAMACSAIAPCLCICLPFVGNAQKYFQYYVFSQLLLLLQEPSQTLFLLGRHTQSFSAICTPCPHTYTLGQTINNTFGISLALPIH